ncbi:MAG TPA: hypothetical protein EYP77_02855 [Anaerolineae bacterium]|nr:hypothetical protein [Anaerolineae bacterium]
MAEEIDLRTIAHALGRRWKMIGVSLLLVVLVTFVAHLLTPKAYRASVVLSAPAPRSGYFQDVGKSAYMQLALSWDLAQSVVDSLRGRLQMEEVSPDVLLDHIRVRSGSGDLFYIEAVMPIEEDATLLANAWARETVVRAASLYDMQSLLTQVAEVKRQIAEEVAAADTALSGFRARTGIGVTESVWGGSAESAASVALAGADRFGSLGLRWQNESAILASYEVALDHLRWVREAVEGEVAQTGSGAPVPWDLLRVPILEEDPDLAPAVLASQEPAAVVDLLSAKEAALTEAAEQVRARLQGLNQQLAELNAQLESLVRDRQRAEMLYREALIAEQERMLVGGAYGKIYIVAPASKARDAAVVGLEAKLVIAATVGLVLGALVSLWQELGRRSG